MVLTTWQEWVAAHPDTKVLDIDTGVYPARQYRPEEDIRAFYHAYFNSPDTMFPVWNRRAILDTKEVVLGLDIEGEAKAYPVRVLRRQTVVNDTLGGTTVVVIASTRSQAARVYERKNHTFEAMSEAPNADVIDSEGNVWNVTEDYLTNKADPVDKLKRLPSHMAFWFGWYAFHPDTGVYGLSREEAASSVGQSGQQIK